jgi:hypothetical protein
MFTMRKAIAFGMTLIVLGAKLPAWADDGIAGAYCMQGRAILEGQTFYMREASIPVDAARDTVISMFRDNTDALQVMISSVNAVYSDPNIMKDKLMNGEWHAYCVKRIRGF